MRAALGWALLGALFIALTIISVRMIGAKGTFVELVVNELLNGQPQLSPDGSGGVSAAGQKLAQLKSVLKWIHENVAYLPGTTPERLLLQLEGRDDPGTDAKITWFERTTQALNRPSWQPVTSADVLSEQERALATISTDAPEMIEIRDRVKRFLQKGSE